MVVSLCFLGYAMVQIPDLLFNMYCFFRRQFRKREYVNHREDDTPHKSSTITPMNAFDPDLESGKLNDNKIEVNQYIVRQLRNIVGEMMAVNEEQMNVKFKGVVDAEVKKRINEIVKIQKHA